MVLHPLRYTTYISGSLSGPTPLTLYTTYISGSLSGPTPLTLYTTYISESLSGPTPLRYILLTLVGL